MNIQPRPSLVKLASRTLTKRSLNTQTPQFFTGGANRHARDQVANQKSSQVLASKEALEKTRNELLDKLGSNSAGKIVASAGTVPNPFKMNALIGFMQVDGWWYDNTTL